MNIGNHIIQKRIIHHEKTNMIKIMIHVIIEKYTIQTRDLVWENTIVDPIILMRKIQEI